MADMDEHSFGSKEELKDAVELWCSNKQRAIDKFGEIANWNVSAVDNMSELFKDKHTFNENLSAWDTSSVTSMNHMFYGCKAFKSDLSAWETSSVTDMGKMFKDCRAFNSDLSAWETSSVTDMRGMFEHCKEFNSDLSAWETSSVTDMRRMFSYCKVFDSDLSAWKTSSVTDMRGMFANCKAFNSDLSAWDTSSVEDMMLMFKNASSFNSNISKWVIPAEDKRRKDMLDGATAFKDGVGAEEEFAMQKEASKGKKKKRKKKKKIEEKTNIQEEEEEEVLPAAQSEWNDFDSRFESLCAFIDKNQDDTLDIKEFSALYPAFSDLIFTQYDKNQDGILEKSEFRQMFVLPDGSMNVERMEEVEALIKENMQKETNVVKYAAVFPVYSGRKHLYNNPQKEARDMEEQLVKVGYTLWRHEAGFTGNEPPSTSWEHMEKFNDWLQQKKEDNDIDGVFIMVIAHGRTSQGGGDTRKKLKIKLEDCDNFDLEDWMENHLAGTQFPIILAMSCCRVDDQKLSNPARVLKLPNIFLSWGAANGDRMEDGKFVESWGLFIGAGKFMKEEIGVIGRAVIRNCGGGDYDDGLDFSKRCVGGVWFNAGHLVSNITAVNVEDRINKCITKFSGLKAPCGKKFTELKWAHSGTIQGKYTAVFEGNSIAILCSQVQTKYVQGIIYHHGQDSNKHKIEDLLKKINKIQITEKKMKYDSIEQFLKTTVSVDAFE